MKKILAFLMLILCVMSTSAWATISANPGDIRIFNTPFRLASIKVQLSICGIDQTICDEKHLVVLLNESPMLTPSAYFTYQPANSVRLNGKTIYIKIYSFSLQKWSSAFPFIFDYNNTEAPFYQFVCGYYKDSPAHCIGDTEQGTMTEENH